MMDTLNIKLMRGTRLNILRISSWQPIFKIDVISDGTILDVPKFTYVCFVSNTKNEYLERQADSFVVLPGDAVINELSTYLTCLSEDDETNPSIELIFSLRAWSNTEGQLSEEMCIHNLEGVSLLDKRLEVPTDETLH